MLHIQTLPDHNEELSGFVAVVIQGDFTGAAQNIGAVAGDGIDADNGFVVHEVNASQTVYQLADTAVGDVDHIIGAVRTDLDNFIVLGDGINIVDGIAQILAGNICQQDVFSILLHINVIIVEIVAIQECPQVKLVVFVCQRCLGLLRGQNDHIQNRLRDGVQHDQRSFPGVFIIVVVVPVLRTALTPVDNAKIGCQLAGQRIAGIFHTGGNVAVLPLDVAADREGPLH